MKALILAGVLALTGCTRTLYEPSICAQEHVDTVLTILTRSDTTVVLYTRCAVWQAWNDSTVRWDSLGQRLP